MHEHAVEVEEARVVEHEAALGAGGGAGAGAGAGAGDGAGAGTGYGSSALLRAAGYGTSVAGGGDGGRGLLVGDILVVEGGLLAAAGAGPWIGCSMFMPQFARIMI